MKRLIAVGLILLSGTTLLFAQRFGRGGFDRFFVQNNEPPDTAFIFARLRYSTHPFRRSGWEHDYPAAEQHILQIMSEVTGVHVERMSYKIVDISSPEIFKYPFTYLSEPGSMNLTEQEVVNFREYINRGGFVMVDDFSGPDLYNLEANLKRMFPERDFFPLTIDHPIFHTFYDFETLEFDAPYYESGPPIWFGYPNGKGDLAMIICHNNDVGDFWEWIDQPMYPLKPSAESLRYGINFLVYALTH